MVAVAKKHGAMVLVDEANGMGFFGAHGRGVFEEAGVADQVDFVVGTFSKSVGTVGGFCVSNHPKFELLRLVRSEEHTSEIQSLMRLSYDAFCLKKKNDT